MPKQYCAKMELQKTEIAKSSTLPSGAQRDKFTRLCVCAAGAQHSAVRATTLVIIHFCRCFSGLVATCTGGLTIPDRKLYHFSSLEAWNWSEQI